MLGDKLTQKQRDEFEELFRYAESTGNHHVANIAKLALDMDDKGEFAKFKEIMSDGY